MDYHILIVSTLHFAAATFWVTSMIYFYSTGGNILWLGAWAFFASSNPPDLSHRNIKLTYRRSTLPIWGMYTFDHSPITKRLLHLVNVTLTKHFAWIFSLVFHDGSRLNRQKQRTTSLNMTKCQRPTAQHSRLVLSAFDFSWRRHHVT